MVWLNTIPSPSVMHAVRFPVAVVLHATKILHLTCSNIFRSGPATNISQGYPGPPIYVRFEHPVSWKWLRNGKHPTVNDPLHSVNFSKTGQRVINAHDRRQPNRPVSGCSRRRDYSSTTRVGVRSLTDINLFSLSLNSVRHLPGSKTQQESMTQQCSQLKPTCKHHTKA